MARTTGSWWSLPWECELGPLLEHCLAEHRVDRLLVVLRQAYTLGKPMGTGKGGDGRPQLAYPEALERSRSLFRKRILRERRVHRWPGTASPVAWARVLVVDFDGSLVSPMAAAGPRLFDWTGWPAPALPEDLCLFRAGTALPALISVTHERDAWLRSTATTPPLPGASLRGFTPDELMIPTGDPDFLGDEVG